MRDDGLPRVGELLDPSRVAHRVGRHANRDSVADLLGDLVLSRQDHRELDGLVNVSRTLSSPSTPLPLEVPPGANGTRAWLLDANQRVERDVVLAARSGLRKPGRHAELPIAVAAGAHEVVALDLGSASELHRMFRLGDLGERDQEGSWFLVMEDEAAARTSSVTLTSRGVRVPTLAPTRA